MTRNCDGAIERLYEEVYAAHYEQLQERRRTDPNFTIDDIRGFLNDAYVRQDNDWFGQGPVFDATQGAIVAAHEAMLAEWLAALDETDESDDNS